jgi:hypothetical protein
MKQNEHLNDEDFHKLALMQKDLYPDLLEIISEEDIITCFYAYYKRKKPDANSRHDEVDTNLL